jgi:Ca2+-binding EF-hand superfamily protein
MTGELPKASPLDSATELLARFQKILSENCSGLPGIGNGTFTKLIKDLLKDQSVIATPSDADLDAAFNLADADNSGGVDEFEFIKVMMACRTTLAKRQAKFPSPTPLTMTLRLFSLFKDLQRDQGRQGEGPRVEAFHL